jgi:hypothetical protein
MSSAATPSSSNLTRDGIEVKVGQVWRDLDKRMSGREVTVLEVKDGKARVARAGSTVKATRLSVERMHKSSTGWALVSSPVSVSAP